MNNLKLPFSFELPTRIEYELGAIKRLGIELERLNSKKVLIVTDKGIVKAGLVKKVTNILEELSIEFEIFDDVEPNPKDSDVEAGAKAASKIIADTIIAIGGGSPIDCAKAIGVLVSHKANRIKNFEGKRSVLKPIIPLITIPTTSGTGSEVTFSSVINDTENKYKMTIKSPYIAAKVAIIDPELTITMPPLVTASTGIDALTHAIEAYTVKVAEPISDALALYSIQLISKYLPLAVTEGNNIEARSGMLMGSLLAGLAFSHSDVGSVHCMAEALGGVYDAPHGICNSILLPFVMEYNKDYCKERYAKVAEAMGGEFKSIDEGADMAIELVRRLSKEVNLPDFKSLNIKEEDFDFLAGMSVNNISTESNPRPLTKEDYIKIFKNAQKY